MPGFRAKEYPSKTCIRPECGKVYNRARWQNNELEPPRNYLKRKYCSNECRRADHRPADPAKQTARQREMVSEFRWIVGTDSIVSVASRLGYKDPTTLQRSLHKAGETALANRVREDYQHYLDAVIQVEA